MAKSINAILNLQNKFSSTLDKAKRDTLLFKNQMKSADKVAGIFDKSLGKIAETAKKTMAVGIAGVTAFGVASVNTYKDFEQSMSNVAGTAGIDKTSADYDRLEKAARQAGAVTTKTATEAADALNYMALAGWSVDDSISGLMPILRAAEASGGDLGTVSDLATDSMSALGLGVDRLGEYLDVCALAQSKSNTTLMAMQEAMIGVGGTFKMFDTGLAEGGALLGVLANRGIKGSEAGNALQSTLINLTKKSGESANAMAALGISAYDNNGKFKGITQVLTELNDKTKTMTEEQRNTYLQMIGGKNQITTLNALMSGLNTTVASGESELEYLTNTLGNADGALERLSETMTDNLNGSLSRLTSAWQEMLIASGKEIAPHLQVFFDWVAGKIPIVQSKLIGLIQNKLPVAIDFAKKSFEKLKSVVSFAIEHWKALAIAGGSVIAFMAGFSATTKIVGVVTSISSAFKGLSLVSGILKTGLFALNASFLACPLTWVVAGVVAVGAALVALSTKSAKLREALGKVWNIFKEFAVNIAGKIKDGIGKISDTFSALGPKFTQIGDAIGSALIKLSPIINVVASALSWGIGKAIDFAVNYICVGVTMITNIVLGVINAIVFVKNGIMEFCAAVKSGVSALVNIVTTYWNRLKDNINTKVVEIKTIWENLKTKASDIFTSMFSSAKTAYDKYLSPIVNIIKNLINWIKDVKDGIAGIGGKAADFILGENAMGTSYWRGGLTTINERGGEIVDLPSGTRIYPHDVSKKMVANNDNHKVINLNITLNGGSRGDADYIAKRILDALEGV